MGNNEYYNIFKNQALHRNRIKVSPTEPSLIWRESYHPRKCLKERNLQKHKSFPNRTFTNLARSYQINNPRKCLKERNLQKLNLIQKYFTG
jgi:hypothetical protein